MIFRLKYPEVFHEGSMKLNKPLGTINTVVLICSSLTVALGIAAIRRGKQKLLGTLYTATVLLACIFLGIKDVEYAEKFHHGIYPGTAPGFLAGCWKTSKCRNIVILSERSERRISMIPVR